MQGTSSFSSKVARHFPRLPFLLRSPIVFSGDLSAPMAELAASLGVGPPRSLLKDKVSLPPGPVQSPCSLVGAGADAGLGWLVLVFCERKTLLAG